MSPEDEEELGSAKSDWALTEEMRCSVRHTVVRMVKRSSYREVSRLTGFSTNTLQRWVREAGR